MGEQVNQIVLKEMAVQVPQVILQVHVYRMLVVVAEADTHVEVNLAQEQLEPVEEQQVDLVPVYQHQVLMVVQI
jgi:hypothetical protein